MVIEYVKACCFNTLLIMSYAAYDKYQSQPPHTYTTLITPATTSHKSGGAIKRVTLFWDSFVIQLQCSAAKTITDVSVPSQILGLHQHVKQKPPSRIPAKVIYYSYMAPIWALALSIDDCSHGCAWRNEHDVKQNELSVVVHWWGSSEIKYLFMQAWKLV